MKQLDYRVVSGANVEQLQRNVNRQLENSSMYEGKSVWLCQGGIHVLLSAQGYQMFSQAMVLVATETVYEVIQGKQLNERT